MDKETQNKIKELEDKIKELRLFGEELQRTNANLQSQINQIQSITPIKDDNLDKAHFPLLTVDKLYAGIPIFTSVSQLTQNSKPIGINGQIYLINATGRKVIAVQIGNTVSSVALT